LWKATQVLSILPRPAAARKFPKFTTVAVHSLMKRTCLGGNLEGNCTGIRAAQVLQPPVGSPPAAVAAGVAAPVTCHVVSRAGCLDGAQR
jgi:hypothetical protein